MLVFCLESAGTDMGTSKRIHQMTVRQWEAAFPNDAACKAYLHKHRWPSHVICPRCGSVLSPNRPDLSFLSDVFKRPERRGLFSWLLPLSRVDLNWRMLGRRPGTLIAYVNSLLNLARLRLLDRPGSGIL